ncbi:MAG: hypothetical protein HYZ74_06335, partial [Elusimicrobia bacterium]|nr:hypothetical protein [Elusimicrobiota bacterium]
MKKYFSSLLALTFLFTTFAPIAHAAETAQTENDEAPLTEQQKAEAKAAEERAKQVMKGQLGTPATPGKTVKGGVSAADMHGSELLAQNTPRSQQYWADVKAKAAAKDKLADKKTVDGAKDEAGAKKPSFFSRIKGFIAKHPIMIGAGIGAIAGLLLAPFTGPFGPVIGAALGAAVGGGVGYVAS